MRKNIVLILLAMVMFLGGCMVITKDDDKIKTLGISKEEATKTLKIIDNQKPADK